MQKFTQVVFLCHISLLCFLKGVKCTLRDEFVIQHCRLSKSPNPGPKGSCATCSLSSALTGKM